MHGVAEPPRILSAFFLTTSNKIDLFQGHGDPFLRLLPFLDRRRFFGFRKMMTLVILLLFNSNGGRCLDGDASFAFSLFAISPLSIDHSTLLCYTTFIPNVERQFFSICKSIYKRSFVVTSDVAHGGSLSTFGYFTLHPTVFYDLFSYLFLSFPLLILLFLSKIPERVVVVVAFASEKREKRNTRTLYGSHIPVW